MKPTIYASFSTIDDAERATGALLDSGLKSENISLIAHEQYEGHGLKYVPHDMHHSNDHTALYTANEFEKHELGSKTGLSTTTPADAAVGAEKGMEIGLGVGVVAALAALFIPGVGLVIGGGALATAIIGAAATTGAGAIAGGALGYLKDQGVNEDSINLYRDTFNKGGAILAINMPDAIDEAEVDLVLSKYNAINISGVTYATAH
ncbi:MAG: hypothetical protein WCG75_10310 [Armatimonadota bacterium]